MTGVFCMQCGLPGYGPWFSVNGRWPWCRACVLKFGRGADVRVGDASNPLHRVRSSPIHPQRTLEEATRRVEKCH